MVAMVAYPGGEHSRVAEAEIRAALDETVLRMLRPVTGILALLLIGWAIGYQHYPARAVVPLSSTALVIASLFMTFSVAFPWLGVPHRYANAAGFLVAELLVAHRLLSVALTQRGEQVISLILLVIGVGFILLSTPWLIAFIVTMLVGWVGVAWAAGMLRAWSLFTLELGSASVLSLLIHIARVRTLWRQERLWRQYQLRNAELERRALQLETLINTGHAISAILDLDDLLRRVVELVQARFGYYYVGVFRLDESGQYMVSVAGTGEAGRRLTAERFRLRVGEEGLIGWVAQHRQALYVNDVTQDARYVKVDAVARTRSELILPLRVGEWFIGVLDIQSDRCHAFDDEDVRVFQSLADQIAIAIQNADRYRAEQARRRLSEKLFQVGQALSRTLDVQEVLDLILATIATLVPFNRGSVMLRDGEELEIVAAVGFPAGSDPLQIRVPIRHDDVFGQIYHSRAPLIVPEVLEREDWQHVEGLPQARSWLGVPLIVEDKVIGIFSLTREEPKPFTEEEATLAIAFAGQAAIALQNARLYSRLLQAYDQLERMDRVKSDFITIASHELRTPLTTIRGFGQMLLNDPLLRADAHRRQMIENLHLSALRLQEIVESMVDIARIDSRTLRLYLEETSIATLIEGVVGRFRSALRERNLRLEMQGLETLPPIEADPELLSKVFYHLVMNAIKYTPDGGSITVSGRVLATGWDELPEGGIEIVVRDTGIGIDPAYHELIFAKFYQTGDVDLHSSGKTKFKGGGPGLGLAIARGIVEAHGGKIWVESPGYDEAHCPGSVFHVVLPLRPTAVEIAREAA